MSKLTAGVLLLALVIPAAPAAGQDRAAQVGRAIGSLVRLEAEHHRAGSALPESLSRADSLYAEMMNSYRNTPVSEFVGGNDDNLMGTIVDLLSGLPEPSADDPAGKIIAALRASDLVLDKAKPLLDGYGGEFELVVESRRYLRMLLGTPELLMSIGLPVTLADLGLDRADSASVKQIAETAGEGSASERGSEAYRFYSAMLDLDDLGGRFGRQQNETDLAGRLMAGRAYQELAGRLKKLRPMTVVFFGGSQTDNRHWSSPAHYPKIIEEVFRRINPGVKIFNAGIGGDDSGEGLARIEPDVLAHKPDICFVLFGGNDCAYWGGDHPTVSPDKFEANIEEIVRRLKEIKCRPVLISYPTIPSSEFGGRSAETLDDMNRRLVKIRDKYDTGWVELAQLFAARDPGRTHAVDGIHFCPEAHVVLSEIILRKLVEME